MDGCLCVIGLYKSVVFDDFRTFHVVLIIGLGNGCN